MTCLLLFFTLSLCKRNPFLLGDIKELIFTKGMYITSRRVEPIVYLDVTFMMMMWSFVNTLEMKCESNFPEHVDWDESGIV